jgi:hypothetical protein
MLHSEPRHHGYQLAKRGTNYLIHCRKGSKHSVLCKPEPDLDPNFKVRVICISVSCYCEDKINLTIYFQIRFSWGSTSRTESTAPFYMAGDNPSVKSIGAVPELGVQGDSTVSVNIKVQDALEEVLCQSLDLNLMPKCPTNPATTVPSKSPVTSKPTDKPTDAPMTIAPTNMPSTAPVTSAPTDKPTHAPTTRAPTHKPSNAPVTSEPTDKPTTGKPTNAPVKPPTNAPHKAPTKAPTRCTTKPPVITPTKAPANHKRRPQ